MGIPCLNPTRNLNLDPNPPFNPSGLRGNRMQTALDIENAAQLIDYLRAHFHIQPNERPRLTILAGGVSNRAVLVERETGEAWVLKQALAKLRVQVDWFSDPERIRREALGLIW